MATETISQDLSDLLATRNFDVKYTDAKGMDAAPGEAVTFAFDWVGPSGKNYGTAVAVVGEENDLMFLDKVETLVNTWGLNKITTQNN